MSECRTPAERALVLAAHWRATVPGFIPENIPPPICLRVNGRFRSDRGLSAGASYLQSSTDSRAILDYQRRSDLRPDVLFPRVDSPASGATLLNRRSPRRAPARPVSGIFPRGIRLGPSFSRLDQPAGNAPRKRRLLGNVYSDFYLSGTHCSSSNPIHSSESRLSAPFVSRVNSRRIIPRRRAEVAFCQLSELNYVFLRHL